jgi:hypothetical protein
MASRLVDALTTQGTHSVGNLNNFRIKVVPNGAKVITAAIDNFTIGELGFDGTTGERTVVQLSGNTVKGVLVAAPERRFAEGEQLCDFYNAIGELARVVILEPNFTRFETSAYSKNAGVTTLSNGMVAHFDTATKKFIVSASGTPHANFAAAENQYVLIATEDELDQIDGQKVIRLEVTK